MKKFLTFFLIGQMLLLSFIYRQSIYDIYTLNHMGADGLCAYYLEEPTGENLGKIYDSLMKTDVKVEIVKKPVTSGETIRYEIYDTDNVKQNKIVSVSKEKEFIYKQLTREEFIDSTGIFKCNLSKQEVENITSHLNINVNEYKEEYVNYGEVVKSNALNLCIMVLVTQFVLFVYTFLRIKENAIKKLMGYTGWRMVKGSVGDFLIMELSAVLVNLGVHIVLTVAGRSFCIAYFVGLVVTFTVTMLINLVLLFNTQISIRFIDISAMIKNKMYTCVWDKSMKVIKMVFLILLTCVISVYLSQYSLYHQKVSEIKKYSELNRYFTSNGYNSDEYDKLFSEADLAEELSERCKQLYNNNQERVFVMDVNAPDLLSKNYLELHNTSEKEIFHSYKDNFAVVNKNYLKEYMTFYDENGRKIDVNSLKKGTVLIPEMYKGEEVKKYCASQYQDMVEYDSFYGIKDKKEKMDISVVYIKNEQRTDILTPYLLEKGTQIKNSVIYLDSGEFGGMWYLDMLSNGKIAFQAETRDEFSVQIQKVHLEKLINIGTLLTPLSEEIHYYEFICRQTGMFIVMFAITLLLIIYLSNYVNVMVNRKEYALKYLMGYSDERILSGEIFQMLILLFLTLLMKVLKIKVHVLVIGCILDFIFLKAIFQKEIVMDVVGNMKGD